MRTTENINKGIELLGVDDIISLSNIGISICQMAVDNCENLLFSIDLEKYNNRYKIPTGLTKKQYQTYKRFIQRKINYLLDLCRINPEYKFLWEDDLEKYIDIKKKVVMILNSKAKDKGNVVTDIKKAKQFPVENILKFNNAGFAICPFHDEKTPSLKLYRKTNSVYCFGGCQRHYDSVDLYQKIYGVNFLESIKKLS